MHPTRLVTPEGCITAIIVIIVISSYYSIIVVIIMLKSWLGVSMPRFWTPGQDVMMVGMSCCVAGND